MTSPLSPGSVRLRRKSSRPATASLLGGASIAACLALAIPTAHAADGIWNSTTTGLWSVPANWLDNAVADGIGAEASFDLLDLTSEATVRLDSSRTVGSMVFGDLDPATAGGWLIDNNDNPANVLTLATEVGMPTITVNELGTGMAVTMSATLAGTNGFAKAGTGTLVLSGENTLTGGISLDAGVLAIHSDAALGGAGSGLTFTANSTLRFAAPATLAGARTLTINAGAVATFDTEANDVEIQSTFAGAGALTKLGSGALRYTGTGAFSGPLSINGGIFSVEESASLTTGALTTANTASVQFHVNGGSYTSTAMSTINPPAGGGFVMDSGSAAFNGGIQTSGAADQSVITINGGTFTAASVNARRDQNSETNFTRGFIFRGGTGTVGTMGAGTSNSWGHLSIEGGTFTVTGAITIGNQVTSGRGGAMRVTGGVFNSTDTVDGIVLSKSATIGENTNTANNARITFSGGVSTVEKFTMGYDGTVAANGSNGRARIDLTGGTLYIGSGGIVKNGTPTTSVNLDSGVLGAKADWASAVGVTMGSAATNNVTIKAADEADVAHNITVNGPVGGAGGFTKTGGGALILAGDTAAYTGGDVGVTVSEGTLQIGNGGTTGNLGTAPILNDATLAFNRSNTLTFGNNVSGTGSVLQAGPGVTSLTGTLTHTGGTTVNAGTLRLATTLPGSVTVNNGGALGGPGPATGSVTVNSGGRLSPSDAAGAASGLLTLGNVSLNAGSILDLEFTSLSTFDHVAVSDLNGLTINGAGLNIFSLGTTDAWTIPGTYNLFQYNGALGGLAATDLDAALSVLNPAMGFSYDFGTSNGFITLEIASTTVVPTWNVAGGGSWSSAGNWTPSVPNAAGATANFGDEITAPSTITLDGDKTVGTIRFGNANAYTIAQGTGGTLFLNQTTGSATIDNVAGNHVINVPMSLVSNTTVSVFDGNETLTVAGNVGGAGKLTKSGLGTLILSGTNTHTGGTTIESGTVRITGNQALGSNPLTFAAAGTLQAGANNLAPTNAIVLGDGVTGTINTNGHTMTLSGVISDVNSNGGLNKAGTGRLVVTGTNTYSGPTRVSEGTLSVASITNGGVASPLGRSSSAAANLVLNGGTLEYTGQETTTDRLFHITSAGGGIAASGTGPITFATEGAITFDGTNTARTLTLSGTNTGDNILVPTIGDNGTGATSLVKAGPGTWMLDSANTFTGETVISGGTLILNDPLALGGSTLNYNNQGGTIDFFVLAEATLGGLGGNQDLEFAAPFTLTLGNNNQPATYGGSLSGDVTLIKVGTGTQTLAGENTFTGPTTVNSGILRIAEGGSMTIPALTVTSVAAQGNLVLDGGSLHVTGTTTLGRASSTRGFLVINSGSATFDEPVQMVGDGGRLQITGGEATFAGIDIVRVEDNGGVGNLGSVGLVVSGGNTTTTSIGVGTGASWGFMDMNGGTLTNTGAFVVGTQATAGRGGRLRVREGTLISTDASGLVLGDQNGNVASAEFVGGTSTFEKITLVSDDTISGVNATLNVNGGAVYVGSGGIDSHTAGGSSAAVTLTSGILGAKANWSSAQTMDLAGNVTIKAADAADVPQQITLTGGLTGGGGFTKSGGGDLTLSGENFYAGETAVTEGALVLSGSIEATSGVTVSGGEIRLGRADAISDSAPLTLAGGTLNTAGFSETVGALTLSVASSIDLGDGASLLRLGDSAGSEWTGTLSILNWNGSATGGGTDRLFFGDSAEGLTPGQLAAIQFVNPNGIPGSFGATILPNGEVITTIPEPGSLVTLASGCALLLGLRRRRR